MLLKAFLGTCSQLLTWCHTAMCLYRVWSLKMPCLLKSYTHELLNTKWGFTFETWVKSRSCAWNWFCKVGWMDHISQFLCSNLEVPVLLITNQVINWSLVSTFLRNLDIFCRCCVVWTSRAFCHGQTLVQRPCSSSVGMWNLLTSAQMISETTYL